MNMSVAIKLIISILLVSPLAWARIDMKQMKPLNMPVNVGNNDSNVNEILPTSLSAGDTSRTVIRKMIDNSLSYWWKKSDFKNTSVGRAADKIENKMKAEMDLGSSGTEKTDHRLSFKVLAAQALAKFGYTGWVKAAINFDAKSATTEAEVMENLSNNKDLVISHSVTSEENKSQLSLRWNW